MSLRRGVAGRGPAHNGRSIRAPFLSFPSPSRAPSPPVPASACSPPRLPPLAPALLRWGRGPLLPRIRGSHLQPWLSRADGTEGDPCVIFGAGTKPFA